MRLPLLNSLSPKQMASRLPAVYLLDTVARSDECSSASSSPTLTHTHPPITLCPSGSIQNWLMGGERRMRHSVMRSGSQLFSAAEALGAEERPILTCG